MERRDYILNQTKDFAKFLALLFKIHQKEDVESVEKQLNLFLDYNYKLKPLFSFNELLELYQNKQLSINEIKEILQLVIFNAEMLISTSSENSQKEFLKALEIIDFLEKNSNTFDFSLSQYKNKVNLIILTNTCV